MPTPTPSPTPTPILHIVAQNTVGQDSTWFWAMVQALAITTTLFLILRQIRLQRLANMLSALHTLDSRWNSSKMFEYRKSVCKTPFDNKPDLTDAQDHVLVFFEDIGMQVKLGILDSKLVWDTYSAYIEFYWPMLKPKVEEQWNKGDLSIYENFKFLHEKMSKISIKKKLNPVKTHQEIDTFAKSEVSREIEEG